MITAAIILASVLAYLGCGVGTTVRCVRSGDYLTCPGHIVAQTLFWPLVVFGLVWKWVDGLGKSYSDAIERLAHRTDLPVKTEEKLQARIMDLEQELGIGDAS